MKKIGGNTPAQIQTRTTVRNQIGETVKGWITGQTVQGFLDYSGGDSKYGAFNAKIQESTHVFVCDFVALQATITAENSRLLIDGKIYNVLLIDDPMGLHRQLEFYLKYTGGQNG